MGCSSTRVCREKFESELNDSKNAENCAISQQRISTERTGSSGVEKNVDKLHSNLAKEQAALLRGGNDEASQCCFSISEVVKLR